MSAPSAGTRPGYPRRRRGTWPTEPRVGRTRRSSWNNASSGRVSSRSRGSAEQAPSMPPRAHPSAPTARTPVLPTPASTEGIVATRTAASRLEASRTCARRVAVGGRRRPRSGWASTVEEDLPTLSPDRLRDGSPSRLAGMSVAAGTMSRTSVRAPPRRRAQAPAPAPAHRRRAHHPPQNSTSATRTISCSAQFVVPTCLYVASKLEEVHRRISDIVNVTPEACCTRGGATSWSS